MWKVSKWGSLQQQTNITFCHLFGKFSNRNAAVAVDGVCPVPKCSSDITTSRAVQSNNTPSGWPVISWNQDNVRQVQEVVPSRPHWMVQIIAVKVRIAVDSCHTIISKNLKMHHVHQHILPRILMQEWRDDCMRISGDLISSADDPDFL